MSNIPKMGQLPTPVFCIFCVGSKRVVHVHGKTWEYSGKKGGDHVVGIWLGYGILPSTIAIYWDLDANNSSNPTNWTHYPCGSSCTQEVRLGYDDWGVKPCTFTESGHGSIYIHMYIYIYKVVPHQLTKMVFKPINYRCITYKL